MDFFKLVNRFYNKQIGVERFCIKELHILFEAEYNYVHLFNLQAQPFFVIFNLKKFKIEKKVE